MDCGDGKGKILVGMEMGIKLREPIGTGQNPPERGREGKINGGWGDDGQILFYCVGVYRPTLYRIVSRMSE